MHTGAAKLQNDLRDANARVEHEKRARENEILQLKLTCAKLEGVHGMGMNMFKALTLGLSMGNGGSLQGGRSSPASASSSTKSLTPLELPP